MRVLQPIVLFIIISHLAALFRFGIGLLGLQCFGYVIIFGLEIGIYEFYCGMQARVYWFLAKNRTFAVWIGLKTSLMVARH